MTIFFETLTQNTKIRYFWSKIQAFLFFQEILELEKIEGADLKYDILFSNSSPKIPKSGIFGPIFKDFQFCIKLCSKTNSNDTDFKYDKISFEFQSKDIQIRLFWSLIQAFSFFHEISQSDKFQGTAFKYENIIFKFQSNKTNWRISNMTMVFSSYSPQIRILGIFVLSFKDF